MKTILIVVLLGLSSTLHADGLGGVPIPTTPFMTVAVCLNAAGKPIPKTQHLKQTHQCAVTGKADIDKINKK
ncbi:hypothetical protein ABT56_15685 [Photobacterium aquae]|uniref:Uncharacterized protein n=1 Tax=Photobacterium aquae TaxID=1195763 RepID=A0A0J1GWI3_9GAMM|nr:hypothetical protein [Photobacterium aquae]KLV04060.1 hypothetical protein ABT56_15685 [Photobacterium aquae]